MASTFPNPEQNDPVNETSQKTRMKVWRNEVRPARRARQMATSASVLVLASAVVAVWFWQWSDFIPLGSPTLDAGTTKLLAVEPRPISTDLNILGTIGPARSVAVVAPFDGVIGEKQAQIGDAVKVGDILLTLDAGDITSQYRTAQSAFLKAQMAVRDIQRWESSTDVLRAKRTLESSETTLATLDRQIHEIKGLFDQGIVSRNEYEGIVQQRDVQLAQVESNRQDLNATLKRGDSDNRQLLQLDLDNAADKVNELKQQLAGAKVAAAVAGVLTSPPTDKSSEKVAIESGARVTRGTPLFAISDTTNFVASGTVDEVDVNKIKVGQTAIVSSDALLGASIAGKIVTISSEATQQRSMGETPTFGVRVSFTPQTEEQRKAAKLGMSARISIQTYANPTAIVVPPTTIIDDPEGPRLSIIRAGERRIVNVSIGETVPDGIEVLSGLLPGDQIVVSNGSSVGTRPVAMPSSKGGIDPVTN
ncbi:HlyD family efflux transporter periplasmic adaptor subunit (plasmid) [Rhizobium beringeri]|uniref:efflux RND transporter periplasmic adaptor subunit n=1 Tax=Rhizobium beringeri TaxID=3019934 RepID=UPI002E151C73|nr:HlyD family efflux transporter periplasmic adaptor subunit [Rhizobium beringeri]